MSLPLNKLINALTTNIQQAEIASTVNLVHWQNIYAEHEMLKNFSPSTVRVREVKVSMPIAIDEVQELEVPRPEVTAAQISKIFSNKVADEDKRKYATALEMHLHKKERHLLSRTLFTELAQAIKKDVPKIVAEDVDMSALKNLRRDYVATPREDNEVKVIFRNAELEKIPSDQLIRMEFVIEVD